VNPRMVEEWMPEDVPKEGLEDDEETDRPCERCGHPAEEHDVVDENLQTVICGVIVENHWCPCEGYQAG
jgi:hypothetical protein